MNEEHSHCLNPEEGPVILGQAAGLNPGSIVFAARPADPMNCFNSKMDPGFLAALDPGMTLRQAGPAMSTMDGSVPRRSGGNV